MMRRQVGPETWEPTGLPYQLFPMRAPVSGLVPCSVRPVQTAVDRCGV